MDVVKRLLAVFLIVAALAVTVHFVASALYEDAVDVGLGWNILNWPMAAVVVVALVVHYLRKRALDRTETDGSITREYVEVNLALYATIVLALWFFWNWTDDLMSSEAQSQLRRTFWVFIDPLFVLIGGITGMRLWRCAASQ